MTSKHRFALQSSIFLLLTLFVLAGLAPANAQAKSDEILPLMEGTPNPTPLSDLMGANEDSGAAPDQVTEAYIAIGDKLSLDRLRSAAEQAISDMPYWDRLATRGLTRELEALQGEVTKLALRAESFGAWSSANESARSELLQDLKKYTGSQPNFAQFALATDAVRKFVQAAS